MSTATMNKKTFERICEIVYETSGIHLTARKEALVSARVGKRMRALGIPSYEQYLEYLEDDHTEVVGLLDAVSTNVTSFFREPHHFEYISDQVSSWYADGQRRFRFWSAACSTGEEPYSLAMVLREAVPFPDVDLRILATDISTEALATCELATYDERRMTPVPHDLRERWFIGRGQGEDQTWEVKKQLRTSVVFRRMNLSATPFPMKGPLDAVFCRNVMIYFDDSVRMRLLSEAHRLLKPGGLLVVGHAESLAGMISDFKYVRPSIYRKV
ncbi:MAG: protein-glutamate O-methyltransferase CheR [Actinobacteria bacterium]|nr:MAG: protein-glutamate O-methyltransferase CheR [Actinomycetota bacterium]